MYDNISNGNGDIVYPMIVDEVINALYSVATEQRRKTNEWFFKTDPGQYGHGDKFIGVSMPDLRKVAKSFYQRTPFNQLAQLLGSAIHELRLCALIMLVYQYPQGDQGKIYRFYTQHFDAINNWDLVDASAPHIVGSYLYHHEKSADMLLEHAHAESLWVRRIAIISTFYFIRNNAFEPTLTIAKILLRDKEDLIHKATGWMLREIYKRDNVLVRQYLKQNYAQLPRTTLRYAIEKMDKQERQVYLKGEFNAAN